MLFELRSYLLADSTVGAAVAGRMFPVVLPQNTLYPALSYQQVSGIRDWTLCGPTDWARIRVTINVWAKTYDEAHSLADAVRNRLQGVAVTLDDSPLAEVGSIRLDNEFDSPFETEAGIEGVYRVVQDYIVSHLED